MWPTVLNESDAGGSHNKQL